MIEPKVIIVILRRPNRSNPKEMRSDPFWEFGSFGCTGCHKRNLMNPHKIDLLNGARLAFAQGGPDGFRLVYLTPPIETFRYGHFAEVKWSHKNRPFKYSQAPLLIKNDGDSDFPLLKKFIKNADLIGWEAKFASKFRSRRRPLETRIAKEITRIFDQKAISSKAKLFISKYYDALPYPPPKIDNNRQQTYSKLKKTPKRNCT